MNNHNHKPVIVGIVGHLPPEHLNSFKQHIESFPYFRLIRFQESDNKLWIVSREDKPHDY